jgi:hypothetical protein
LKEEEPYLGRNHATRSNTYYDHLHRTTHISPGVPNLNMPNLYQTLVLLAIALLTRHLVALYYFLGYANTLTYNDASCTLHSPTDLHGSEDIAIGKEGLLFITSGDLHTVWEHGSTAAKPGGIWAYNINPYVDQRWVNSPQRLPLHGFDQDLHGFHGHGFYISNQTDRLYVVNHAHQYSGIEIFRIEYNGMGRLPTLHHESTIGGDGVTFKRGAINDVVEGGEEINEIYVTTWLPHALPEHGKKSNQKTMSETMGLLDNLSVQLFGIKKTEVVRCVRNGQKVTTWDCDSATKLKFVAANGITISPDRSQIYVNDPPMRRMSIFNRTRKDGSLQFVEQMDTLDVMDNIEYLHDDTIIMGSIPKPFQYSIDREILGKDVPVSGGAAVAFKDKETNEWLVEKLVTHDGTLLSQVSAAARWDKNIFMGSPFSPGFLECKLD